MVRGPGGNGGSPRTVRGALAAVVVLLAGVIPGARAESDGAAPVRYDTTVDRVCALPPELSPGPATATVPARVRIRASLPTRGRVGEPVLATGVTVTVTLPGASRTALAGRGAVTVGATSRLAVAAAQGGRPADAVWTGRTDTPVRIAPGNDGAASGGTPGTPSAAPGGTDATGGPGGPDRTGPDGGTDATGGTGGAAGPAGPGPGAPSGAAGETAPATGTPSATAPTPPVSPSAPAPGRPTAPPGPPLELTLGGPVPAVTASGAGELTLTPGTLALELTPFTADGTPAKPAALPVTCSPREPQSPQPPLATVRITGADGTAPPPGREQDPAPATGGGPGTLVIEPLPGERAARPPRCVGDTVDELALVAYVTGFSNVEKLDGAARLPLACVQLVDAFKEIVERPDGFHLLQHATGELDYRGKRMMPPAKATFLSFGGVPTTATMELTQLRTMTIDTDILLLPSTGTTLARVALSLRLYDVEVNGVPLDVGPNCRTRGPLYSKDPDPARDTRDHVVLTGVLKGPGDGYQLVTGGVLDGTVTIPPFTGCGVGEDLDPLLTAAVSGPGNYIKQVQGAPCSSGNPRPDPEFCTPGHEPVKVPKPER